MQFTRHEVGILGAYVTITLLGTVDRETPSLWIPAGLQYERSAGLLCSVQTLVPYRLRSRWQLSRGFADLNFRLRHLKQDQAFF